METAENEDRWPFFMRRHRTKRIAPSKDQPSGNRSSFSPIFSHWAGVTLGTMRVWQLRADGNAKSNRLQGIIFSHGHQLVDFEKAIFRSGARAGR